MKMNVNELKAYWFSEQEKAHINGWDFSYIEDRMISEEDRLPWDYAETVNRYRKDTYRLLDIDTGGGEFLLSLGHPNALTCATEDYPPNTALCRRKFAELGIEFCEMGDYSHMPFPDESFDIVINRHGSYDAKELFRVLKPGGVFVTQQVGDQNDRELVEMLLPGLPKKYEGHDLANNVKDFKDAGFKIIEQGEAFPHIGFTDTGALVWFARVIEWEFIGFEVEKCFERLLTVEEEIRSNGSVGGKAHRFYLAAQKPKEQ